MTRRDHNHRAARRLRREMVERTAAEARENEVKGFVYERSAYSLGNAIANQLFPTVVAKNVAELVVNAGGRSIAYLAVAKVLNSLQIGESKQRQSNRYRVAVPAAVVGFIVSELLHRNSESPTAAAKFFVDWAGSNLATWGAEKVFHSMWGAVPPPQVAHAEGDEQEEDQNQSSPIPPTQNNFN